MTATIEELDIGQLFDSSIECDWNECSEDAKWSVKRSCCQYVKLYCEPHKNEAVRFVEENKARPHMIILCCPYCDRMTLAKDAWLEVTPLW